MGIQHRQLTPSFSRLVGQEKAKTLLGRALVSEQLAHAYLFRGPDGVGKQLFARSLATAVNCQQRQSPESSLRSAYLDACGHCSSCRKYSSGNHPDFLVISPEKGTIKIDRIREMIQSLSYPPYESRVRVVLLEDIHTMRAEAANSLLKILEEPPENNLLILTGQEETIQVLLREKPELELDTARLLARLSEGCPGQALLFYRSEMVALWRELVALLSDPGIDGSRDVGMLLQAAETMAALKEELLPLFGLVRIWLRDMLVAGSLGHVDHEQVARDEGRRENKQKSWSSSQLFDKLDAVGRAEKELARNCNRTLVCEVLLFQLQK